MNIKYTSGTITEFTDEYLVLELFDKNGKRVYRATIPKNELEVIVAMNKNIVYEAGE